MLKPNEAYELFIEKFPDVKTESLGEIGNYYTCTRSIDNDMTDDFWKIDKNTGIISEMDFLEYLDEVKMYPENYKFNVYKVSDFY